MRRPYIMMSLALVALYGYGCSGGGAPEPDPTPTPSPTPATDTRTTLQKLLSGNSPTGSKRWLFVRIKPAAGWTGANETDQERPCPAIFVPPAGGFAYIPGCSPNGYIEFRADGKARVGSTGESTPREFFEDWSLTERPDGATIATPLQVHQNGSITGVFTVSEVATGGFLRRIRLTEITSTFPGAPSGRLSSAGFEYVLEGPGS
jgi:hypothetical protein